ncbi:50S ribosomal protein L3 [Campylobacter sp. RM10532]|uniref:50S ribosomal protein L3 n=1 Tax=Campylobacter molothri TaxID=1032242 RepID=A0ACC5W2P7_9BACT|nr:MULTISPECIES: 50S ribosomal protein L3 [unclassified Campylobacter]MBZ7928916.1 50S ribosomal protein L3 [Campylobacter sp. RM10542]MBZ7930355.1 50S ribosomal protein L3 [Campylobacter sp. W0067]MBZ7932022.1 50S ribosomal protein L3 [Campylobacter sp. RM12910]MBZ7933457.1 50S ribosomal protein L3 [Campylobacter sp. RM10543]MBZ7934815.1 50S ribosomal protein L3 [Campylobacter sp. W0065]MBZ7938118.1 50S ribosomal protein L3 [Campylobacter sp. RM10538]MBZ7941269.1 50S ribosomal protein L3 [C
MEYIVEKIGMSRTINSPSIAVTLLKVVNTKVCEVENGKAIVAYSKGKTNNKCIAGQQKKYNLSAEFNRFATLEVANTEAGDLDETPLSEAKILKVSFNSKGRGYSGVMKRHNFAGGPASHGSRFHRRHGSIGNREWPGRVQPGMKMAGHYGNTKITVKNEVVSYDSENKILVVKGAVPGYNGAMGKIRIAK